MRQKLAPRRNGALRKTPAKVRVRPSGNQEKLIAFAGELDELHEKIKAKLGKKDLDHIKKVEGVARLAEIMGRFLIHFSMDPLTWSAGIFALSVHKQLHTTEIGHSALHGCWDGMKGAELFYSDTFKWKIPIEEKSWKREHNIQHHQFTNILGKDPDLSYGMIRAAEKVPWAPYHLIQVTQFFWTAPIFLWTIGFYVTGLVDAVNPGRPDTYAKILPDKKLKTLFGAVKKTAKKMLPHSLYNFVLWPALAGPMWWKVLFGNLSADALCNIYSAATIYAGHFGDDLNYYDPDFKARSRGEWYKAQVEAAHNYDVPLPISILCGGLDTQIEHHLFPKLPPNRLREIQPQVQEICERYGIKYHRDHWGKNLGGALKRLAKLSLPFTNTATPTLAG